MKLRCPYCKQIRERISSRCPHCGKLAVLPARLRKTTLRERKKMREQIERQADRQRRRDGAANFRPGRDPRVLFLAMFVLVICGALLFSRSSNVQDRTPIDVRFQTVASELEVLRVAAERFHQDVGRYPTPEEGVIALVQRPEGLETWGGHYVTVVTPDPWKIPYRCRTTTNDIFVIESSGPDTIFDTPDDIPSDPVLDIVTRQLHRYHYALARFHKDTGRYPEKMEGLRSLLRAPQIPGWQGPYMQYLPRDPWKRDYYYMPKGDSYDLRALGPDQTPYTEDDVTVTQTEP